MDVEGSDATLRDDEEFDVFLWGEAYFELCSERPLLFIPSTHSYQ